jgi:hypothetical protein
MKNKYDICLIADKYPELLAKLHTISDNLTVGR